MGKTLSKEVNAKPKPKQDRMGLKPSSKKKGAVEQKRPNPKAKTGQKPKSTKPRRPNTKAKKKPKKVVGWPVKPQKPALNMYQQTPDSGPYELESIVKPSENRRYPENIIPVPEDPEYLDPILDVPERKMEFPWYVKPERKLQPAPSSLDQDWEPIEAPDPTLAQFFANVATLAITLDSVWSLCLIIVFVRRIEYASQVNFRDLNMYFHAGMIISLIPCVLLGWYMACNCTYIFAYQRIQPRLILTFNIWCTIGNGIIILKYFQGDFTLVVFLIVLLSFRVIFWLSMIAYDCRACVEGPAPNMPTHLYIYGAYTRRQPPRYKEGEDDKMFELQNNWTDKFEDYPDPI